MEGVPARTDDLVIIARTDARGPLGLDQAIERAGRYAAAGADVVFVEAPRTTEEIERIAASVDAPLLINMVQGGLTPDTAPERLAALGYRIAIHPGALLAPYAPHGLAAPRRLGGTLPEVTPGPRGLFELVGLRDWSAIGERYDHVAGDEKGVVPCGRRDPGDARGDLLVRRHVSAPGFRGHIAFADESGQDAARGEDVQDERGKRAAPEAEAGRGVLHAALGEVQTHAVAVAEGRRDSGDGQRGQPVVDAVAQEQQGASGLRRRTAARILIHEADRPWLEAGRVPPEGRSGRAGRLLDRLPKLHWAPFAADGTIADGELLEGSDGLRVIHTPGHSPGHVVLFHEPSRTALLGDAVFHRGEPALGPAALAADPALRVDSLAKLPHDLRAVGFAHGTPLAGAGVDAFLRFLSDLGQRA
ncbi:isocitrate lyase/phosphoenolpyruvate mutase family protein [Streptomyces fodineus]|uniref:isocitrate lyase/phosphoenolpyruvate mutase family protein n=1 Tax=Streptomyces fodineus TaxID=1904616 RepID=UPI001D037E72|nr:isocitrate lyase/phosphoenolpyruvate mutase family protein [Streptomyces fodineus]